MAIAQGLQDNRHSMLTSGEIAPTQPMLSLNLEVADNLDSAKVLAAAKEEEARWREVLIVMKRTEAMKRSLRTDGKPQSLIVQGEGQYPSQHSHSDKLLEHIDSQVVCI
jgi:hypothetical protein